MWPMSGPLQLAPLQNASAGVAGTSHFQTPSGGRVKFLLWGSVGCGGICRGVSVEFSRRHVKTYKISPKLRRILRRDLRQATSPKTTPRKLRHEAATPTLPCYDPLTVKKPAKTEEASSISRGLFSRASKRLQSQSIEQHRCRT